MKCDNSSLCIISCILASSFHYFFVLVVFGDNINISVKDVKLFIDLKDSHAETKIKILYSRSLQPFSVPLSF